MFIEEARQALAACESTLKGLLAQAAQAGDYSTVMTLTSWAQAVSALAKPTDLATARSVATPSLKKPNVAAAYPRFCRRGNELVKFGWSKTGRREYQHRADRAILSSLVSRLTELGSAKRVKPATTFGPAGADQPLDYQHYVVLGWLKGLGLIQQHGRQGYTVPDPKGLNAAVNAAWDQVEEE